MKEKRLKNGIQRTLNNPKFTPITNLFSPFYSGIGSIVMFHRVVQREEDIVIDDMEITAAQLEKTIQYFLNNNYEIISIEKAYKIMAGREKRPKKFAVFTFDDGYKDNYTIAYPIFKKYNVPFTIYVTTCFPDKTARIWWYALDELIQKEHTLIFRFEGKEHLYPLQTSAQKTSAYGELRDFILRMDDKQLNLLLPILFDQNGIDLQHYIDEMTMDWEDIQHLAEDGLVTIGAHTSNHYNLKNVDEAVLQQEILASKNDIESRIGKPVEHFAFPYGSMNEAGAREFEIARQLGFKTSVTTRCGNIFASHSGFSNCLPRITPSPALLESFPQIYVSGFVPALRQKFRRVVTN